jgi:hypothetical protein
MILLYQYGTLLLARWAMADEIQATLIAISIIVVVAALAFAGYILIRNNKNPTTEDQMNLGDFFFVSKDDAGPAKRTEAQPLGGNEASKTAAIPAERAVAPLQISNMRIEPAIAKPGDMVTIWFDATNLDSSQMQYEVTLKINDRVFNSRMISILPGSILHPSFKVSITEPGNYTADVNGANGVFTVGQ